MIFSYKNGLSRNKYWVKAGKLAFLVFFLKGVAWLLFISMTWDLMK